MANITIGEDLQGLIATLEELAGDTGAYTRVLQAGGEIVKSIEKEEIEYQKFIDEGDMIRSVSAVIKPKEQLVDIYPVGSVKRGRITTRNAEKAAYLHYGVKGGIEASKFMDNVKKDSEVASQNAMQSEFNQILREKGL